MRTIDKIITKVDGKYGAPMGRHNVGTRPPTKKVYDCMVPMPDGCYDRGGVYWGLGKELRVSYTKDLSYINFYRVEYMVDKTTGQTVKVIEYENTLLPGKGLALVERVKLRDGSFYKEKGKIVTEQVFIKQSNLK